uniref:Uncharacterized protein n=1 Tax=Alexandrium andersonii TaxID=327968 RepID=A0A7S2NGV7_9DINO
MLAGGLSKWPYQPVRGGGEQVEGRGRRREPDHGSAWRLGATLGLLFGVVIVISIVICTPAKFTPRRLPQPRLMLDDGFQPSAAGGVLESAHCLSSSGLSDFSSQEQMEMSGWLFGWTGPDTFRPAKDLYASSVPYSAYWGFSESVDGEIALVLRGRGFFTLDFGNSWTGPESQVVVYLNGVPQMRASANAISVFVKAPFRDGDVLRIVESNGVLVINSIFFDCADTLLSQTPVPGILQVHTQEVDQTASSTTITTSADAAQSMDANVPSTTVASTATLTTPVAMEDMRISKGSPQHKKRIRQEPAESEIKVLRVEAEKQERSELKISEQVAEESQKLKALEHLEKQELLKAQRDMELKDKLEEELHEVRHD